MNATAANTRAEETTGAPAVHRPPLSRQIWHCVIATLIAGASYWMTTRFVMQTVVVDGDSMRPTLSNSQRLLLNRVEFLLRDPQWGDIVVIRDPEDGGLSVKRIVAVQGQTVELSSGEVIVDGLRLREGYLPKGTRTFSHRAADRERVKCGPGQFFVLGDNRNYSADSRLFGPVPRENILGVVVP